MILATGLGTGGGGGASKAKIENIVDEKIEPITTAVEALQAQSFYEILPVEYDVANNNPDLATNPLEPNKGMRISGTFTQPFSRFGIDWLPKDIIIRLSDNSGYTKLDNTSEINDTQTGPKSTWSSEKISTDLGEKLNKTDIKDDLISTDTDKALSANQGKVLKEAIDLKTNSIDINKLISNYESLYVDNVNGLDTNNGSILTPFKTIQAAINSFTAGSPHVIYVKSSTTQNITFRSADQSMMIIFDAKTQHSGIINLVDGNTSIYFLSQSGKATINGVINDASKGNIYFDAIVGGTYNKTGGSSNYITAGYVEFCQNSNIDNLVINLSGNSNIRTLGTGTMGILTQSNGIFAGQHKGAMQSIQLSGGANPLLGQPLCLLQGQIQLLKDANGKSLKCNATNGIVYLSGISTLQNDLTTYGKIDFTGAGAGCYCYVWQHSQLAKSGDIAPSTGFLNVNTADYLDANFIPTNYTPISGNVKNHLKAIHDKLLYLDATSSIQTQLNNKQTQIENLGNDLLYKPKAVFDIEVDALAETSSNITGTSPVVDGVVLTLGQKYLKIDPLDATKTGIFTVASPSHTSVSFTKGNSVYVKYGNMYSETQWKNTNKNDFVIGTDAIYFSQYTTTEMIQANQLKAGSNVTLGKDNQGNITINSTGGSGGGGSVSYLERTISVNTGVSFTKGDPVFVDPTTKTAKKHGVLTPGTGDAWTLSSAETSVGLAGTSSDSRVFISRLRTSYSILNEDGAPYRIWMSNGGSVYFQMGTIAENVDGNLYINWNFPVRTLAYSASKIYSVVSFGYNNIGIANGSAFGNDLSSYVFMIKINTTDSSLAGQGYYNIPDATGNTNFANLIDMTLTDQYTSSGTGKLHLVVGQGATGYHGILTFNSGSTGAIQGSMAAGKTDFYTGGDPYGVQMCTVARISNGYCVMFYLNASKTCSYVIIGIPTSGNATGITTAVSVVAGPVNALNACPLGTSSGTGYTTIGLSLHDGSSLRMFTLCFDGSTYKYQSNNSSFKIASDNETALSTMIKPLSPVSADIFKFTLYSRSSNKVHMYVMTVYNNGVNAIDSAVLRNGYNLRTTPFNMSQPTSSWYEGSYVMTIITSGTKMHAVLSYPLVTSYIAEIILKLSDSVVYNSDTFAGICLQDATSGQDVRVVYQGLISLSEFPNYPQNIAANTLFYPNGNDNITTTSPSPIGGSTKILGRSEPTVDSTNSTRLVNVKASSVY